jgi:exopolysaccharide biosynthesis WecB/TagA/CpsF family protein
MAIGSDRVTENSRPRPLVEIDGQAVNIGNMPEAVARTIDRLQTPGSFIVCTLNLDHLVKRRQLPSLRRAYEKAELVTADGFPIVVLARLDGVKIERTTGSDLIRPLCEAAAKCGLPIFLFGATFDALCRCARALVASNPRLEICGVYAPPSGFSVDSPAADEAISLMRDAGARLCFVALGSPLQEEFAARAVDEVSGMAFLGVGAGLEFIGGSKMRSPKLLQRMNLEWAWRLASDPRRLGLRYAHCAQLFMLLLLQKLLAPARRGANPL